MRQRNRPIAPAETTASPGLTPTAIVIGHKAQAGKLSIASSPVALAPDEICHAAVNELLTVPTPVRRMITADQREPCSDLSPTDPRTGPTCPSGEPRALSWGHSGGDTSLAVS
jgi:hypothetical protein